MNLKKASTAKTPKPAANGGLIFFGIILLTALIEWLMYS